MIDLKTKSAVCVLFFLLVGASFIASPVIQSGDGRLVVYEADSLLHAGRTAINQYGTITNGFPCYRVGWRVISRYPYGTAFVTAPFLLAAEVGGDLLGHNPASNIGRHPPRELEKDLASAIAALGVAVMVLLCIELTGRLLPSVLTGAVFAFGTAMWSTVSRGLWQHGPLILLTTFALVCLVREIRGPSQRWLLAAGLLLGGGFVVRPTAAAPIILVGIYVLRRGGIRSLGLYALGVAAVVIPSLIYNVYIYGRLLNPFYFPPGGPGFLELGLRSTFLVGLAGTMFSPARGLFVYSPVLALCALPGRYLKDAAGRPLRWVSLSVVLLLWLTTANTHDWPGGYSYGPRLLSDALPWLVLLLAPAIDALTDPGALAPRPRRIWAGTFVVLTAWSVFVNARGAFSWSTQAWNARPVDAGVDTHPSRFWDWSDPQFLRADGTSYKDVYPYDTPDPAVKPGTQCES